MKKFISAILIVVSFSTVAIGDGLVEKKAKENITKGINAFTNKASQDVASFVRSFENVKYLDFEVNTQELLKPTFSMTSVYEIIKFDSGSIFNQTSLNTHDSDETINLGLGIRKLLNDNKLLIGSNIFFDHQFGEVHQRIGLGAEAISSIADLRYNYYDSISGRRMNAEGLIERGLDGWDLRADYHLPINQDVNIFVSAFEFENPQEGSTYIEKGSKYGADAKLGNWVLEAGYMNDNQARDAYFGNIKYVVNFGSENESITPRKATTFTDVSDKLYQPVKRENKIRVVKISASGVVVGGF
tara:strand:+ start:197 stop:1096 length:900 start_codon:yes stop_codon:yes gene_type:complete